MIVGRLSSEGVAQRQLCRDVESEQSTRMQTRGMRTTQPASASVGMWETKTRQPETEENECSKHKPWTRPRAAPSRYNTRTAGCPSKQCGSRVVLRLVCEYGVALGLTEDHGRLREKQKANVPMWELDAWTLWMKPRGIAEKWREKRSGGDTGIAAQLPRIPTRAVGSHKAART